MAGYGEICFGPIKSRRFGISLGLDLLGPNHDKQCNFDCLYCELPKSKKVSMPRHVPSLIELENALVEKLKLHPESEVITLCGNGEPTIRQDLLDIVHMAKKHQQHRPLLILSNGSTICNQDVQNALMLCDKVKLSLDSARDESLKKIDRPIGQLDVSKLIVCMSEFRRSFRGELIIEILLVKNINDSLDEITPLKAALAKIKPDLIHLSTIARSPAYSVEPSTNVDEFANALKPFEVIKV